MCIIMVKPEGINLPEFEYIQNCYLNNSDGLGFMTTVGGAVIGQKDFRHSYEMYVEMKKFENRPIIAHFRWATHGREDATASHPFPISNDLKDLRRLFWKSDIGVAHNGIFSGFGTSTISSSVFKNGKWERTTKKAGLSDTQEFIIDVLSDLDIRRSLFLPSSLKLIAKLIGNNKLAFLDSEGRYFVVGKFVEDMGCLWSNDGYKEYIIYTYENYAYGCTSKTFQNNAITIVNKKEEVKFDDSNMCHPDCPIWCPKKEEDINCWVCDELGWEKQGTMPYCSLMPIQ